MENYSLEELWKESEGRIEPQTFRELVRLGKRIDSHEGNKRIVWAILSAAAVVASIVVVSMVTFSHARNKFEVSPLDCTRNLVAEYGQTSSITLADGTKVSLNAGSTLLYPESFVGNNRIVFLTGEGNFDVAKDPDRPFIVKTAHMDVRALGTVFCVHSYSGEKTVRTTLREGKVEVDIPSSNVKSYKLEPGMQLIFTPSEKSVSFAKVDARKVLAWEDGYVSFTDASFPEIASVLERRFNISLSYNAENMRKNSLNVRFMPEESLEEVLDVLTLLIPGSSYKKENDRVYWRF